jgi:hypothetical protein
MSLIGILSHRALQSVTNHLIDLVSDPQWEHEKESLKKAVAARIASLGLAAATLHKLPNDSNRKNLKIKPKLKRSNISSNKQLMNSKWPPSNKHNDD